MNKLFNANKTILLFVLAVGGFIGFNPIPPAPTLQANTQMVIPRFIDVPRDGHIMVDVNLHTGQAVMNSDIPNSTVNLNGMESYQVTNFKEVEKIVYVTDVVTSTKLFNRLYPLAMPVLDLARR